MRMSIRSDGYISLFLSMVEYDKFGSEFNLCEFSRNGSDITLTGHTGKKGLGDGYSSWVKVSKVDEMQALIRPAIHKFAFTGAHRASLVNGNVDRGILMAKVPDEFFSPGRAKGHRIVTKDQGAKAITNPDMERARRCIEDLNKLVALGSLELKLQGGKLVGMATLKVTL